MNLPLAPCAALLLGVLAAAGVAILPGATLEALVMGSGLPSILSAAEPPLGMTARLAIAGGAGTLVGLVSWFGLFVMLGSRALSFGRKHNDDAVPVLRRADAHPDAPARAPLLATRDLGTPFLEVTAKLESPAEEPLFTPVHVSADSVEPRPLGEPESVVADPMPISEPLALRESEPSVPLSQPVPPVERDLPVDLEQPLAAFDPGAIPEVPMPPPVQVAPLRPAPRPAIFDANERFETFELKPVPTMLPPRRLRPASPRDEAIARPETDATIHALLERLERGVVRRGLVPGPGHVADPAPRDAERGLEEALVTLRNLARRAS